MSGKESGGLIVPRSIAWTVALFLAAWTAGGLYYAGRVVAQMEIATATLGAELKEVKLTVRDHSNRIVKVETILEERKPTKR